MFRKVVAVVVKMVMLGARHLAIARKKRMEIPQQAEAEPLPVVPVEIQPLTGYELAKEMLSRKNPSVNTVYWFCHITTITTTTTTTPPPSTGSRIAQVY